MLSFNNLTEKYGYVIALSILIDLERHVHLNSTDLASADPESRLQKVMTLMEATAH
jgi:hypothetical protein